MTLSLQHVTVDCDDPIALGTFWSAALTRPIDEGASPFFVSIGRPQRDIQPAFFFIKVPEGKVSKNRMHIDLHSTDRDADVARLITLGATKVADKDEWRIRWAVMQDPEGNEFCVA